jgi:hypothetical protein
MSAEDLAAPGQPRVGIFQGRSAESDAKRRRQPEVVFDVMADLVRHDHQIGEVPPAETTARPRSARAAL